MICPDCHAPGHREDAVCASCGALDRRVPLVPDAAPVPDGTLPEPDAPRELRDRGRRLQWIGGLLALLGGMVIPGPGIDAAIVVLGLTLFTAGFGAAHGAWWARKWIPPSKRFLPRVQAYLARELRCGACGTRPRRGGRFCHRCGTGLWVAGGGFGAKTRFAFRRLWRRQPVEPPRGQAFVSGRVGRVSNKYLYLALASLGVTLLLFTFEYALFGRYALWAALVVPPVLLVPWLRQQDRLEAEPWSLVWLAFGWGAFTTLFVGAVNETLSLGGIFLQVAGPVEELAKGLIVLFLATHRRLRRHFNGPVDGLVYGACAGAGFSLAENFQYVVAIELATGGNWIGGVLLRLDGVFGHAFYAGLTGGFVGLMVLRHGRATPTDLFAGAMPAIVLHALNNTYPWLGLLGNAWVLVPSVGTTVLAGYFYLKLLHEGQRDEEAWAAAWARERAALAAPPPDAPGDDLTPRAD